MGGCLSKLIVWGIRGKLFCKSLGDSAGVNVCVEGGEMGTGGKTRKQTLDDSCFIHVEVTGLMELGWRSERERYDTDSDF